MLVASLIPCLSALYDPSAAAQRGAGSIVTTALFGTTLAGSSMGARESQMSQGTDVFEIIHTTRAMRRLRPDPVPDELIRKILAAGLLREKPRSDLVQIEGVGA